MQAKLLMSNAALDDIAQVYHAAALPMQTGTVSVERLWASLLQMFQGGARRMCKAWFDLLADLCFLRYNYRHFHKNALPGWTGNDALLAERMDSLAEAMRNMADEYCTE